MTETQTLLFKLYISNMRKAVETIDKIVPVVNSFDGKVYNARFENKINEVLSDDLKPQETIRFHVDSFDYTHCRIELSFWNYRTVYTMESYSYDTPDTPKHRQVHYLPSGYEDICICNLYSSYNSWDTSKNKVFHSRNDSFFWIDYPNYNTRINARAIVEAMQEKQKDLLKEAENLEHCLSVPEGFTDCMIEAWEKKLVELKKASEELNHAIPCAVRDIFSIKSWANWY